MAVASDEGIRPSLEPRRGIVHLLRDDALRLLRVGRREREANAGENEPGRFFTLCTNHTRCNTFFNSHIVDHVRPSVAVVPGPVTETASAPSRAKGNVRSARSVHDLVTDARSPETGRSHVIAGRGLEIVARSRVIVIATGHVSEAAKRQRSPRGTTVTGTETARREIARNVVEAARDRRKRIERRKRGYALHKFLCR